MNNTEDIAVLKAEIKALKTEVAGLKEFIQAMYSMISEEEEYEENPMEFVCNQGFGRYNT